MQLWKVYSISSATGTPAFMKCTLLEHFPVHPYFESSCSDGFIETFTEICLPFLGKGTCIHSPPALCLSMLSCLYVNSVYLFLYILYSRYSVLYLWRSDVVCFYNNLINLFPYRYSSTRFLAPGFFHESTPSGPLIHTLKHFRILVQIPGDIRISKLFCGVSNPAEHQQIFR